MAHARRILTFVIAAAMGLGPAGSAMAASGALHASPAQSMHAQSHQTHAGHDAHAALSIPVSESYAAAANCDGTTSSDCCCGDHKANCAETCLHKCFTQAGLIQPDRSAQLCVLDRFVAAALERPPDWVRDPQTPPPRA